MQHQATAWKETSGSFKKLNYMFESPRARALHLKKVFLIPYTTIY